MCCLRGLQELPEPVIPPRRFTPEAAGVPPPAASFMYLCTRLRCLSPRRFRCSPDIPQRRTSLGSHHIRGSTGDDDAHSIRSLTGCLHRPDRRLVPGKFTVADELRLVRVWGRLSRRQLDGSREPEFQRWRLLGFSILPWAGQSPPAHPASSRHPPAGCFFLAASCAAAMQSEGLSSLHKNWMENPRSRERCRLTRVTSRLPYCQSSRCDWRYPALHHSSHASAGASVLDEQESRKKPRLQET